MIEQTQQELYLFDLLRQFLLKEPTKELITNLAKIEISDTNDESEIIRGLQLIVNSARQNQQPQRIDEWLEELAIEFTRLFIGPKNPLAVPYGSYYLSESRSLMTDETIEVRKRYLEAGMAVKDLYSIPDDHIGIELEFVYYLTDKIIQAYKQGNTQEASKYLEMRDDFIKNHMSLWVPTFADRLLESTMQDVYKGISLILRSMIK